jgi:pyridoxal biosynthesis lyase PdxS
MCVVSGRLRAVCSGCTAYYGPPEHLASARSAADIRSAGSVYRMADADETEASSSEEDIPAVDTRAV